MNSLHAKGASNYSAFPSRFPARRLRFPSRVADLNLNFYLQRNSNKMGKRYIIALTQASVDLSLCPDATVADSISSSPPPFGQVVLPRFVKHVRENFPDFDVLSGCSKKDFECREEEEVKMVY